jgi:DnaJ homolog subfamily C member 17
MADVDPYAVLGLAPGVLTDAEIKKAYRKKALVLHPDKRKDSEREVAQREFDALQKAYDILLDPQARKALEDLAKARAATQARFDAQDAKRRKMREDLERRERAAERGKTEEEEARERLQAELTRLRRDFASRKRAYDGEVRPGGDGSVSGPGAAERRDENSASPAQTTRRGEDEKNKSASVVPEHLYRTVKVSWRKDVSHYPVAKLRELFSRRGDVVEDVVIREGKKKKGSALVVFAEVAAAKRAAANVNGDRENPLVTTRAAVPPTGEESAKNAASGSAGSPRAARSSPAPAAGSGGNVSNRDYESVVLDRMRRAQEKAKLIAAMEAEDAATDGRAENADE